MKKEIKIKDANYWLDRGDECYKSEKLEESVNCYINAIRIDSDIPHSKKTSKDRGIKYFNLAREIYWKAKEGQDEYLALSNEDNIKPIKKYHALYTKAEVLFKKAEYLFKMVDSIFNKAEQSHQGTPGKDDENKYPSYYYYWSTTLSYLARIIVEKFEKKKDYKKSRYEWGSKLSSERKIKNEASSQKAESVFEEAKSKFESAINKFKMFEKLEQSYDIKKEHFYTIATVYYRLYIITEDEEFAKKSRKYFIETKKDILGILVSLNKDICEQMAEYAFLYPLLDRDTSDGNFFREAIKNEPEEDKDKYKKVYILSMYIINKLVVRNDNEKLKAYYTKKTIAQELLLKDLKFRLNAINYSNDPDEGKILLDYLFREKVKPENERNNKYGVFAGCFSFNYDSLNQFRLYGKEDNKEEGTGLSIVFNNDFFSKDFRMAIKQNDYFIKEDEKKLTLFRCIYIDTVTYRVETVGQKEKYLFYREKENENKDTDDEYKNYSNYINNIDKTIVTKLENLKGFISDNNLKEDVIEHLLINLRYLVKHIAFKEEQECRILKICRLDEENKEIQHENFKMYIEYDTKVSTNVEKVIFGPKAKGIEMFKDYLAYKGLDIQCEKSVNSLE